MPAWPVPRTRLPLLVGVLGLLACAGYVVVASPIADAFYTLTGIACVGALLARAIAQPSGARAPWALAAGGVGLWVAGDALGSLGGYDGSGLTRAVEGGDIPYMLGYPVLAGAVWLAIRKRCPCPDRGLTIEAVMLLMGVTLPVYEFWIRPVVAHRDVTELMVSSTYPVLDLLLLGVVIRLLLGAGGRTAAGVLCGAGVVLTVTADAIYNVQSLRGTYTSPSLVDAGWMLSYVCWTVAALHPSARRLLDARPQPVATLTRNPTFLLGLLFVSPLAMVTASYVTAREIDLVAVLLGMCTVGLVLAVRLRGMAREGQGWTTHALFFVAGVVVLLMAIVMAHGQSVSVRRTESARLLTTAQTELTRLWAIEADARAGARGVPSARQAFDRGSERFAGAVHELYPGRGGRTLIRDFGTYASAVGRELDRFGQGRRATATAVDQAAAQPAYDRVEDRLDRTVRASRARAAASARRERLATAALLALSGLILLLLGRRFTTGRREVDLAEERERATLTSERRFRALVAGSADIISLIDAETRVLAHPETVDQLLGHPAGTMLNARIDAALSDDEARQTADLLAQLEGNPGDCATIDWRLRRADGSTIVAEARIRNYLSDPHLQGFVLNVRDVTERRDLESELEHRAFHDHLTGLANRALLEDRLRHALSRSGRTLDLHAVIMLDLDDFKAVNDSLGHDAGDVLLNEVAARLKTCVRAQDTLARFGGDEFVLLVEDVTDVDEALATAHRVVECVSEPYFICGQPLPMRTSAGVAVTDGGVTGTTAENAVRVLRNADLAMYEAKRLGGGSVELFAPAMHEAVAKRLDMRAELQRGLERGEFVPHYQPIVELSSRRVIGFEALVRWQHPERGLVMPGEFVPLAEQTGLVVELGASVLRQATQQMAAWNACWDKPRYVSVNVAGAQVQRDELRGEVTNALRDSGLSPEHLLLELTETALIQDSDASEMRLRALRELGVRLAIDDFGTGYSSLSYLQRFSLDLLKIDKSFVDQMRIGQRSPLVEAILTMARALGLKVVAEGIETPAQMFSLMERGCRVGQGYLFARPLPAEGVEAFMAQGDPVGSLANA